MVVQKIATEAFDAKFGRSSDSFIFRTTYDFSLIQGLMEIFLSEAHWSSGPNLADIVSFCRNGGP